MEILMKVKCSAGPNPNTIKVVDHHHQLQQQHNPTRSLHPNGSHHSHIRHNFQMQPNSETILPNPCLDYSANTSMNCCTAAAQKNGTSCQVIGSNPTECPPYCEYATCCGSGIDYACCAGYSNTPIPTAAGHANNAYPTESAYLINTFPTNETQPTTTYEYQEPEENFVSIDDEKIKAFLQKIGEEEKLKASTRTKQPFVIKDLQKEQQNTEVFEIIELDVARDVEKLQRLRKSAEKRGIQKSLNESTNLTTTQFFSKSSTKIDQQRKSPNISLVPKTVKGVDFDEIAKQSSPKSKENIIARIDLLDSDSEVSEYGDENGFKKLQHAKNNINDDDDDDTTSSKSLNPLLAAAAVSCELGCENDEQSSVIDINYSANNDNKVYVVVSDDEHFQLIDEREEGTELRWDDFEEQSSSSRERQIYECHICAKTVQSNYNLRRHMMIHTGERPFGCDLCDRRFREISDLKKHRRRHASQTDFLCMICRINPPLETDSTRCGSCDTKNGALIAAVRPDTIKPPPEYEHVFGLTSRLSDKRKSITNQVSPPDIMTNNDSIKEKVDQRIELTSISTTMSSSITPTSHANVEEKLLQSITFEIGNPQAEQEIHTRDQNTAGAMRALARKRETFKCPLCKRIFGTRHNLKRHFMIHTGEKPYSCPHCRKPFRELSTLKKHMVTHRRDRWYKCMRCNQKYRDYLDYMEHKKTHKGEGSDCDSDADINATRKHSKDGAFNSYDDEDEDTMEYDGDSLECCECGQRFTDIDQFSEHIKEHEQSRVLYECYICQQLFDEQKDLLEHMNDKHQNEA